MKTTLFALTAITAATLTANLAAASDEIYNWKNKETMMMKTKLTGTHITANSTSREIFNDKENFINTVNLKDSGIYNMNKNTYTPLYQN